MQEVLRIDEALSSLSAGHSQMVTGEISGMKRSEATYPLISQARGA